MRDTGLNVELCGVQLYCQFISFVESPFFSLLFFVPDFSFLVFFRSFDFILHKEMEPLDTTTRERAAAEKEEENWRDSQCLLQKKKRSGCVRFFNFPSLGKNTKKMKWLPNKLRTNSTKVVSPK